MLSNKSSTLGPPPHPIYRGVEHQRPLLAPRRESLDLKPRQGMATDRNNSESPRLVRYRKAARDLLDPSLAPVPQVQPASHLPPGRTLRRMPRLEAINRIYQEQAAAAQRKKSTPKPEKNESLPVQSDDGRLLSMSSHLSDESEPVVENARIGLKTSALAAVVVDVDQGPVEQALARGTSRRFPLASRSETRRVDVVERHQRRSSSASTSSEASQLPVCRVGTLKNFLSLTPEVSIRPSATAATPRQHTEPVQRALQHPSTAPFPSARPTHSGWPEEYANYLHALRPHNRRLIVTNPDPPSETSSQANDE